MGVKQIADGAYEWTELGTAYRIAAEFGQDPIRFARRLAREPAWVVEQLAFFVTLREAARARRAMP